MAVLYYTRFQSIALNNYEVELWSDATGTSPLQAFNIYKQRVIADGGYIEDEQGLIDALNLLSGSEELTAQGEGVVIERQGESDTFFDNPIRSSRANAFFIVSTDAQLTAFKDIATDPEGTYALKVYRNNSLLFVGRVLADQMRFERADLDGKVVIEVAAVDALNLLEGFYVDSAWFSNDRIEGIYLLRKCLEYSGLDDFYSVDDYYIYDGLEQYETATQTVTDQKLATFFFSRLAFVNNYDIFGGIELNYVTAKRAIEIVLEAFGARIHHDSGAFYIVQPNAYQSTTLTFHRYTKNGTYKNTQTLTHSVNIGSLPARPQWLAKPVQYYQPPFRIAQAALTKSNGAYVQKPTFNTTAAFLDFDRMRDDYPMRLQINLEVESSTVSNNTYQQVNYRIYGVDGSVTPLYYYWDGIAWMSQVTIPNYKTKPYKYYSISKRRYPINIIEDYDAPLTSGPAANIVAFHVDVYTEQVTLKFTQNPFGTGFVTKSVVTNKFVGSIAVSQSYSTFEPYKFTYNSFVKSTNNLSNNSIVKTLPLEFYDNENKYEKGVILVGANLASAVTPTSWGVGWEAGYAETFQQALTDNALSIYSNFIDTIRGTWLDAGSFNAYKSLGFDSASWLLNGATWSANSERVEGEFLKIAANYGDVIETGEEDDVRPSERVYFQDQINVIRDQVNRLEDVVGNIGEQMINEVVNLSTGSPDTALGSDATYSVALFYDDSAEEFSWEMRQLGKSLNVTSDITTFPTEYEIFVCDTSGGSITIDLPSPPSVTPGLRFGFVKINSNNSVILDAGAGYQINDAQLLSWSSRWETYWVQSDGTQWYIVASNK